MTKVKRKTLGKNSDRILPHRVIPFPENLWALSDAEMDALVESWRIEGVSHICLDFNGLPVVAPNAVMTLMRLYRKLRDGGGDLLILNATEPFKDLLWTSSVGYLIHMDQKVQV